MTKSNGSQHIKMKVQRNAVKIFRKVSGRIDRFFKVESSIAIISCFSVPLSMFECRFAS
jgi:hypothetical protein